MFARLKNLFVGKSAADLGGLDNPSSDLMRALTGAAQSISKKSVNAETAMRVPAVKMAATTIEELLATVSFSVFERLPDGGRRRATEHPAHRVVNKFSSEFESAGRTRAILAHHAMTHGFGVAAVSRVRGEVHELIVLKPGTVSVSHDEKRNELVFKRGGAKPVVLNRRDLVFIPETASDGFKFEATIKRCRDAVALAMILEEIKIRFFSRGGQPGGLVYLDRESDDPKKGGLSPEAVAVAKKLFDEQVEGAANYGRNIFMPERMKYEKLAMSNVDGQLAELSAAQTVEIARAFSLPATILQDLSRATWSNSAAQLKQLYQFCLASWIERFESAYSVALLAAEERERFYIEADVSSLLSADPLSQAQTMQTLIASRILSPSEARERLNLPKVGPEHGLDSFVNPNTTPGTLPAASETEED